MSYLLLQVVSRAITALTLLGLATFVDPGELGTLYEVVLYAAVVQLVLDAGRARSLQRVISRDPALLQAILAGQASFLGTCLALLAGGVSVLLVADSRTWLTLALVAVLAPLGVLTQMSESVMLGLGANRLAAAPSLVIAAASASGYGLLITSSNPVMPALALVQVAGSSLAFLVAVILLAWRTTALRSSKAPAPPCRLPHAQAGVINASAFIYYRGDALLVAALLPPAALAAYATAYRLLELAVTVLQLAQVARLRRHVATPTTNHFVITVTAMSLLGSALAVGLVLFAAFAGRLAEPDTTLAAAVTLLPLLTPAVLGIALSQSAAVAVFGSLGERTSRVFVWLGIGTAAFALATNAVILGFYDVVALARVQPVVELAAALALLAAVARTLALAPGAWPTVYISGCLVATTMLGPWPWAQAAVLVFACIICSKRLEFVAERPVWEVAARW